MQLPSQSTLASFALLSWLLKDLGWVLLCPYVAWPSALVAICLEVHLLLQDWPVSSWGVRVHDVATLLWLCGNAIWMTSELLFDPDLSAGRLLPWHERPLAGPIGDASRTGDAVAYVYFIVGLMVLVSFYVASIFLQCRSNTGDADVLAENHAQPMLQDEAGVASRQVVEVEQPPASVQILGFKIGEQVYTRLYIGPWLLKDIFWTLGSLWPALICSVLVMFFMSDCLRRYGDKTNVALLLWVGGNTVWIIDELAYFDATSGPRVGAGAILLCGAIVTAEGAWGPSARAATSLPNEKSSLLDGQSTLDSSSSS